MEMWCHVSASHIVDLDMTGVKVLKPINIALNQ